MKSKVKALLVHHREHPWQALKLALDSQLVETRSVPTCGEALGYLWSDDAPHLVFTDTQLPDGNWSDVITLARKAPVRTNVIVVSAQVDVPFYLEAIDRGAFDLVTPPFEPKVLAHIVRCAAESSLRGRAGPFGQQSKGLATHSQEGR